MAFDGFTVAAVTNQLNAATNGTRIYKISQPDAYTLALTIKGNSTQFKLLLSADASLPLVYITKDTMNAPLQAPGFCMLLRKHLTNAKIISVTQPGLERVIRFELEHLDEMGDLRKKALIIELMGKYSNIIFVDEEDMIIDAIKHVSHNVSSVREVLPGRKWFIPCAEGKLDPLCTNEEIFLQKISEAHMPVFKALYTSFTGFSPVLANEICFRAHIDGDASTSSLNAEDFKRLFDEFDGAVSVVKSGDYSPEMIFDGDLPKEYTVFHYNMFADMSFRKYESISELLYDFYKEKSVYVRIRQKSVDLRKITQTALERNVKKADLQSKQMEDTKKKDKYRIYGELLNTYGYNCPEGAKTLKALNYYTNEEVTIPLDPMFSAKENAKKYFDKYQKLKRTAESLETILKEVNEEIVHLESIMTSLDIATSEEDLAQIKEELVATGYIKYKGQKGKETKPSKAKPLHFVSSDGFDIYVGKNNIQNDWLTFEFANGNDWWFHAKKMPGSHVVVRTNGKEVPDTTFEEAGRLAAFYSKGRENDKVEIDYLIKKNVKKPSGAKPGFVVYYTNYSMVSSPKIAGISQE